MEYDVVCPYCGQGISIWVDEGGGEEQHYTEDCSICCRPIEISVAPADEDEEGQPGDARVQVRRADD